MSRIPVFPAATMMRTAAYPAMQMMQRPPQPTPESVLSQIGGGLMGGLEYVGKTLDKPGRAIRGLLAGRPEELANIIPFSDMLGITDPTGLFGGTALQVTSPERAVGGRQLLEMGGILDPNRPGFDLGDIAGFGAEVLLDPLTYMTLGGAALSKAGQVAKKAGVLEDIVKTAGRGAPRQATLMRTSLDDLAKAFPEAGARREAMRKVVTAAKGMGMKVRDLERGQPLGGLVGLGVPFMDPLTVMGTGARSQAVAEAASRALGGLRYGTAPIRGLAASFYAPLREATSRSGQILGPYLHRAEAAGTARGKAFMPEMLTELEILKGKGIDLTEGIRLEQAATAVANKMDLLKGARERGLPLGIDINKGVRLEQLLGVDELAKATSYAEKEGYTLAELGKSRVGVEIRKDISIEEAAIRRLVEGVDEIPPGAEAFVTKFRGRMGQTIEKSQDLGFMAERLYDPVIQYAQRFINSALKKEVKEIGGKRMLSTAVPAHLKRMDVYRGIPGGTDTVEQLARAVRERGLTGNRKEIENFIRNEWWHTIPDDIPESSIELIAKRLSAISPDDVKLGKYDLDDIFEAVKDDDLIEGIMKDLSELKLKGTSKRRRAKIKSMLLANHARLKDFPVYRPGRYEKLAEAISKFDDEALDQGIFGNHPLWDAEVRLVSGEEAMGRLSELHDALTDQVFLSDAFKYTTTPGETVTLSKMFKDMGNMNVRRAIEKQAELRGIDVTDAKALKALANTAIPKDLADDITRRMKSFTAPEYLKPIIQALDSYTNLFKAGVLTWPARYVRDIMSGQLRNFTSGIWSRKSIDEFQTMTRGGVIKRALQYPGVKQQLRTRGLPETNEAATDILRETVRNHDVVSRFQAEIVPTVGTTGIVEDAMTMALREFPGGLGSVEARSLGGIVGEFARKAAGRAEGTTLKPPWLGGEIRGVRGAEKTTFGPSVAGEQLSMITEGMNRGPAFLKQLWEGVDPAYAAAKVKAAQVDYSAKALTSFERQIMTRAFPFYRFFRGNTPYVMRQLWERPGGRMATMIEASEAMQGEQPLPAHLQATAAIPIPEDLPILGAGPGAPPRFLTGFGLMHEDPMSFVGGGFKGGLLETASRMNPIAKFGAEWASGQSFFQRSERGGRPLGSMDPPLARLISNISGLRPHEVQVPSIMEHAIMNSPFSRLVTSAKAVTDIRQEKTIAAKAVNLLTGTRISDVPIEQQNRLLLEKINAELTDIPYSYDFNITSISKQKIPLLPPMLQKQARDLMQAQRTVNERIRQRRKEKQRQQFQVLPLAPGVQ